MSGKPESIPIDIEHAEEVLDHEFYVAIARTGLFEDISKEVEERASRFKKLRHTIGDLADKILRREREDINDYDGQMVQVTERQPHSVTGYTWPPFNSVTLDDGTRVGDTIPTEHAFGSYIFIPSQAQLTSTNGYSMSGTIKKYNLHDNTLGALEQRVYINFDKVPENKTKGSIGCL